MSKYDRMRVRFLKKVWKYIKRTLSRQLIFSVLMGAIVLAISLGIYYEAGLYWGPRQRPVGDEPHYLIIAQSIYKDHDLDLTNNYANKDYQAWNYAGETLDPHVALRSQNGKQYSFHNIGWPLILSPFLGCWGLDGARTLTVIIGALLALNIFLFIKKITGKAGVAWLIFLTTAFSIPFIVYSSQLFSEILAALLICYAVRVLWERLPNFLSQFLSITAIAYLPWIHVKYIWVSLFLFLLWIYLNRKNKTVLLGIIYLASGALLSYLFKQWYGTYLPNGQYPVGADLIKYNQTGLGAIGLFLDAHFGLLTYAPLYIFSLAGLVAAFIKERFLGFILLGTFLAVFIQHASSAYLLGWSPEGRFLVAVLPMLVVTLGVLYPLMKTWNKVIFYMAATWGLVAGYFLIRHPDLNYSTGEPKYLEAISSKLIDFTHFFPKIITLDQPPVINNWGVIYYWLAAIFLITLATLIFRSKEK